MKNNLIYAEIVQVLQYVVPVYNFQKSRVGENQLRSGTSLEEPITNVPSLFHSVHELSS
jgi:hypothetical protein